MTSIEPLITHLQDDDRDQRSTAALQLGKMGQVNAVDALIQALFVETDLNVQEDITWALNQLKQAAVPKLITFLNNESDEIRHRATHTLGKLKSVQATDVLVAALRDPSPTVRYKATVALGQVKDARAISALIQALDDPVLEVSQGASDTLMEFAIEAAPYLVNALQAPSETIRESAAHLLGVIASPLALEPLIAALADVSPDVRVAASISLGMMGDKRAENPLQSLLDDSDGRVSIAAKKALKLLR